jgi:hypothetical protein
MSKSSNFFLKHVEKEGSMATTNPDVMELERSRQPSDTDSS